MNRFSKICAKIALGLMGAGVILLIIGILTGASFKSLNIEPFKIYDRIINRDKLMDDNFDNDDFNDYDFGDDDIDDENNNKNNLNGNNNSGDTLQESYNGVKSLDISVNYGRLSVQKGSRFAIEGQNLNLNDIKSYVKDGTWFVEDTRNMRSRFFGIEANTDYNSWIRIYIPDDFNGKRINISLGAGTIDIEEISGDKVTLDVGAGKIQADKLTAGKEADFTVGAGKIKVDSIEASNADFDCGMGDITVNGVLTGDSEIECGLGQITLDLDGKEDDYNYFIDSDVGSVIINDEKYNFNSETKKLNKNAKGGFDIECGVGNVTIKVN